MCKRFLTVFVFLFLISQLFAQEKFDFTIRFGQGGFSDDRSPIGKLGGGQIALDIKPTKLPVAISLTSEYYTNDPDPDQPYEIGNLTAVNLLYKPKINRFERVKPFLGGGLGGLKVADDDPETEKMHRGIVYNFEAGVNVLAFWKIGFYGMYKYLYANKEIDNVTVIDFSEHIFMVGITFNFSL